MGLASALSYLRGLLDGLPMPGNVPPLSCKVTAPPVFEDPGSIPTLYLWLPDGRESRDRPAGTMPRNTGPGTPSGFKNTVHHIAGEVQWQNPGPDLVFYAMLDTIMAALRTTVPNPALVTDPYDTTLITQMVDAGEEMSYRTAVRPVPDQQANQYQAVLALPLLEVIQA